MTLSDSKLIVIVITILNKKITLQITKITYDIGAGSNENSLQDG